MPEERVPVVLVVDDEEDIRMVLQARLETAGYEVRTAINGMEALDQIRSSPPDLVILDVMLPGIDGFGVCAMIKRDQRYSRIPVILLTARSQPQDRATGAALGADAHLLKPFRADELLAEVRRLLDGRGAANERVPATETAA
jgi:two-component system response regulator MprA